MGNDQSLSERELLLNHHKADIKTESMTGLTTSATMSYILTINPDLLSQTDMDKGDVFTTVILAPIAAILLMGLYANMPFALSAGMGLNIFFIYTVCLGMGYEWSFALITVSLESIIFILLSFFNVREVTLIAIPYSLEKAVSVGVGLFIVLIGFTSPGLIVANEATYLAMGDLLIKESFIAIVALFTMATPTAKQVRGALLYGTVISTILALTTGVTHLPGVASPFSLPPPIRDTTFHLEWDSIFTFDIFSVVFIFLLVDIFDTVGTLTGVIAKVDLIGEDGNLPGVSKTLSSDAIEAIYGALLGTSTITTFVGPINGVADGERTGLTSLSIAFFFFTSLFLLPFFSIVPPQATAAVLIMVGLFTMSPAAEIDFSDYTEPMPAFLTTAMVSFACSIIEGIPVRTISYAIVKVVIGRAKEVSIIMYILTPVFLLRYLSSLVS